MTRWWSGVALALVASCFVARAEAVELPITARAAIVVDADSGQVLYERDADQALPPASTTKVLTAIIALESGRLDDTLQVSPFAASTAPSKIGMAPGSRARLQDLLYAVLLKSANDAAEVVAEGLGGSQEGFAALMNAKARRIGATNSHFENPHGLTADGHVTSARDLARIFRYGLNIPTFRDILSTRAIDFPVENDGIRMVTVRSHNRLLNGYTYPVIGKTGYTLPAKRCFVGAATGGDREVVIALLGARDLWGDARKLIEFGIEGKTTFDDMPSVMAGRDREDEDSAEEYDRAAEAHQRRHGRKLVVASARSREPVQYVRRWVKTKVHGRIVRTLVAEPVRGRNAGRAEIQVASRTRGGRVVAAGRSTTAVRTTVARRDTRTPVTGRAGRHAAALAAASRESAVRGAKLASKATTKAAATKAVAKAAVKVPVGKMATTRGRPTTAKADARTSDAARGKTAPKSGATSRSQTKVRVSGQRPSVVARR